jgi:chemosensory pili system protein ChpC
MDDSTQLLRGLLIPTQASQILLPSAVVLEVLPYVRSTPYPEAEDWFLGTVSWQGEEIAVISFDTFTSGIAPDPGSRARVAALKPVGQHADLEHYGLLIESVPRLVTLQRKMLVVDKSKPPTRGILSRVKLAGQLACVPDLPIIERAVVQELQGAVA